MVQRVAVFGATGRVGSLVIERALAAGHQVTAVVRTPAKVEPRPGLTVIAADALRADQVQRALAQEPRPDAVVMAVGSNPLKASTTVTQSVTSIVSAMTALGIPRYLGVSGTAQMPATPLGRITQAGIRLAIRAARDHQGAYDVVTASSLDYVLAGCPYIKDGAASGSYHEEPGPFPGGFKMITPPDVADFLARELDAHRYHRQIVGIWR